MWVLFAFVVFVGFEPLCQRQAGFDRVPAAAEGEAGSTKG